jgi:uncharacterized protein (TIGR00369 family)
VTLSSDRFADAPISQLVGFEVLPADEQDVAEGRAEVAIECEPRHHNPMQRVHGGMIAALADAAMGIAFGRTLLESQDFSTIEMKVNFIRPVRAGRVVASARVVERGLRIGFVECEITNRKGKPVATASCTCTVVSE